MRFRLVCPWANDGPGQFELIEAYHDYSEVLGRAFAIPYGFSSDAASVPKAPGMWLL